eukprot:2076335-Ditylum_brightwellii.AAC.1
MMRVALHVNYHGFKFILANLPYNKSIQDGKQQYAQLIKEQNQYLTNYEDFQIRDISEDMVEDKFGDNILCDLLELPGVVGNVTLTPFTKSKGIWQVETTKSQVVEAMQHVAE